MYVILCRRNDFDDENGWDLADRDNGVYHNLWDAIWEKSHLEDEFPDYKFKIMKLEDI